MALQKEDRITMSKKIIGIPEENAVVDVVKEQILIQQQEAIKNDALNKALQDPYDEIINAYQKEFNLIDANKRTEVTEDLINAAAKGENRNGFFLADPEFPIPSVPDGVWKFFAPMSYCYAVGKTNAETYPNEPLGEQPIITTITSLISQIESYVPATRASGQKCIQVEVCTPNPPPGSGETCVFEDQVVPSPEIQGLLSQLKTEMQKWEDSLDGQQTAIVLPDTIPAREAENQAAYDDITPILALINTWQAEQDWDTATNLPDNCNDFDNMTYTAYCSGEDNPPQLTEATCIFDNGTWIEALQESKLGPVTLQPIKDELTARTAFLVNRIGQLNGYFGSITQDTATGELTAQSGWYGARFLIIDSRLNLISGSANGKFGAEKALATQDQIKASNNTAAAAYDLTMKATKAVAPGLDTTYLNVEDASAFSVGDRVYVVANDQEELSGSIEEVSGNRVKLTFKVPKKYTPANKTRLYKLVDTPI